MSKPVSFALVVCTYKRPQALLRLLESVKNQTLYPDEVIIVDGSPDDLTKEALKLNRYNQLTYHQVEPALRGLTKQRNFGISKVGKDLEVVCFLDDDTILEPTYFEEVIKVFESKPDVVGVGGIAVNENRWKKKREGIVYNPKRYNTFDGYVYKEGLRNVVRNYLGLTSPLPSNCMPDFSHGKTSGYPLTGKVHEVDLLIGMSMAFRSKIFEHIKFSPYFEGYGLYEDADFSIRAQKFGKLVIAAKVLLNHYHDMGGRPNMYNYGKMVLRNGWYVWRQKYPNPSVKAQFKWHIIHLVLFIIRCFNCMNTNKPKQALADVLGRFIGWWSLLFNKPKVRL